MDVLVLYVLVALIGSLAQLIDGSLGMGFGVFSSSLLVAAGFSPVVSIATVNTAKVITGLASGVSHWGFGNVRRDWLMVLVLPGMVGGALGAQWLTSFPAESARPWVAAALLAMGILILWQGFKRRSNDRPVLQDQQRDYYVGLVGRFYAFNPIAILPFIKLPLIGFTAALINAFSGAYGPFATSALMLTTRQAPREVVGTVNVAEFFVASTVAIVLWFYLGLEQLSWGLVLSLTIGGAITAPLAAYLCRKLPPRGLGIFIGLALIGLNLRTLLPLIGW